MVAINDAHRWAPWADVLYAADGKWWAHHNGVPEFTGLKFSIQQQSAHFAGVQVLRNEGSDGLELEPTGLRTGKNSGYQAINLAVHLGAKRILLLGYDMQVSAGQPTHFFGDHPRPLRSNSPYPMFVTLFSTLVQPLRAAGVTVINCSRQTALTQFPRMPLREALA